MVTKFDCDRLLKRLAAAITENPQGSIKDQMNAAGISETLFYRIFDSKDGFEHKLKMKTRAVLSDIICISGSSFDSYYEGLKLVIEAHVVHKEIICFLCLNPFSLCYDNDDIYEQEVNYWIPYKKALEAFFVKGGKKGDFKFEFNQEELTNYLLLTIVATVTMKKNEELSTEDLVGKAEQLFLYGVAGRGQADGYLD